MSTGTCPSESCAAGAGDRHVETDDLNDMNACPYPQCYLPAAERTRWVVETFAGPVEHIDMECARGHVFNGPVYLLDPDDSLYED